MRMLKNNSVYKILKAYIACIIFCFVLSSCDLSVGGEAESVDSSADNSSFSEDETENSVTTSKNQLECIYYNQKEFDSYKRKSVAYETDGIIKSGVVPHHLVAGELIASFFKTAADNNKDVENVIIVAPIHNPLNERVCTTESDWNTPFGIMKTDTEISAEFVSNLDAQINDDTVQNDHSASALIPFVKYYFPSAKTSCILIARTADKSIPEKVSELLCSISKEKNCLVIFSVDFSHYLEPYDTEIKDAETLKAIMDYDLEKISFMSNDNMDSPYCVSTFLRYCNGISCSAEMLDHSNSLEILGLPYNHPAFDDGLTSYFIFAGVTE